MSSPDSPSGPRIVVIGGGIGGLATAGCSPAAARTSRCWSVTRRVGGRAGLWEHDGYTWDTGPSWYLMREAFDQYFALMGTFHRGAARPHRPRPALPRVLRGDDVDGPGEVLDVVADPEANYARFNEMSPGDGDAMREYAKESRELYQLALDRFLYTTFERVDKVPNASVLRRLPMLASLLTRSLGRQDRAQGARRAPAQDPRLPRGVPRLLALARALAVLAHEPPRPHGRRALPARRHVPGDSRDRVAGRRGGRRHPHRLPTSRASWWATTAWPGASNSRAAR